MSDEVNQLIERAYDEIRSLLIELGFVEPKLFLSVGTSHLGSAGASCSWSYRDHAEQSAHANLLCDLPEAVRREVAKRPIAAWLSRVYSERETALS